MATGDSSERRVRDSSETDGLAGTEEYSRRHSEQQTVSLRHRRRLIGTVVLCLTALSSGGLSELSVFELQATVILPALAVSAVSILAERLTTDWRAIGRVLLSLPLCGTILVVSEAVTGSPDERIGFLTVTLLSLSVGMGTTLLFRLVRRRKSSE